MKALSPNHWTARKFPRFLYSLSNAIELKVTAKHSHERDPLGSETGGLRLWIWVETAEVKRLVNGMATEKGTEPGCAQSGWWRSSQRQGKPREKKG